MEIQFYQTTRGDYLVLEFIKSLPEKDGKKILYRIDRFKVFGFQRSIQCGDVNDFQGNKYKNLYELIIDYGKTFYRISFTMIKNTCWMIHGFKKKSNKTPTKELDKANKIKKLLKNKHQ